MYGRFITVMLGFAALTGCSVSNTAMHKESVKILAQSQATTPIPPSFLGHPLAYLAAVFGQLMTFSIAAAVMFYFLHAIDLRRDACFNCSGRKTWKSPVNVYRLRIILFMLALLLGVGTNLLVYLSWSEVSNATMNLIYTVDKVAKACVLLPFSAAVFLIVETDEVTTMKLSFNEDVDDRCPEALWPPSKTLGEYKYMLLWVLILSVGVTYAKWGSVAL